MELTISTAGRYTLAKTSGPIDESADELFQQQLHPIVSQGGTYLVVDMTNSPRINSRGLSSLVTLVTRANTSRSRVIYCGICPFVAGVLAVTKLDHFFEIVPSEVEAARRFG